MKRLFYLLFGLVLLPALLYAQGSLSLKDINDNLTNNYYTKTVSDSKYATSTDISAKADKTYVDANFATTAENALKQNIADMVDYYTKTAADLLLADKADTDSVYTKTAADILLGLKADLTYVNATDEAILLDNDSQDVQIENNRIAITLKASQTDMDSAEVAINNLNIDNDSQDVTIEAVRVKSDSNEVGIDAHIDNLSNPHQVTALQTSYTDTYSIAATTVQSAIDTLEAWLSAIDVTDDSQDVAINSLNIDVDSAEVAINLNNIDDDSQDVTIEANKVGVASVEVGLQTHQNNPTGAHTATAISATWTNVQVSLDSIEAAIQGIVVGSGFALESWVNSTLETNFYTQAQTNATIEAAIAAIPAPSVNQTITVTAGEDLSAGDVVSLINTNGTITAKKNNFIVGSAVIGAENVFKAAAITTSTAIEIDTSRFCVLYISSGKGYAIVGTITGSTIAWGNPLDMQAAFTEYQSELSGCLINTDKILVCYSNGTNGRTAVLSISGNTINGNSPVNFLTGFGEPASHSMTKIDNDKALVAFKELDSGSTFYAGSSKIITVSGTTPTPYPAATSRGTYFNNASTDNISTTTMSTSNVVVAYQDRGNSDYGTACALAISSTTITPGTEYPFKSATTTYTSIASLSSTVAVITFESGGGNSVVATVGANITYGATKTFTDGEYNSTKKKNSTQVIIASQIAATNKGQYIIGTVSGTDITLATPVTYNDAESTKNSVCCLSDFVQAISYIDVGNSSYGTAVAISNLVPSYASVSGLSQGAYSSGSDAVVLISGVSDDQTDLIVGSPYFLQSDFTIGTTPISLAKYYNSSTATGEIKIGTAKSATELIIGIDYK